MWDKKEKAPVLEFIGLQLFISVLVQVSLLLLEPYSVLFNKEGTVTSGYIIYAIMGMFLDTPSPMITAYIVMKRHHRNYSIKNFCGAVFHTEDIKKTVLILGVFCLAALGVGIACGIRTSTAWYLAIPAFPLMILGGGVEEIGWRGFLQPALEERFSFPVATTIVAAIWYVWHLTLWLEPTSNHFNDSLPGFAVNIFVWSFVAAGLYKATKSIFACMLYHTFMNTLGVLFDWNALFDSFPGNIGINCYRVVLLFAGIILWNISDKREKDDD